MLAMAKAGDLIDTTEAGKVLGIKRRQVLNLIASGTLPAQRIGNGHVIRRSDLAKVPKDRKPGPKAGKAKPAKK